MLAHLAVLDVLVSLGYAFSQRIKREVGAGELSSPDVVSELRKFARFNGLDPDQEVPELFEQVSKMVNRPRCGLPDHAAARGEACKWTTNTLTVYRSFGAIGGIGAARVKAAFQAALESWEAVANLSFVIMPGLPANIIANAGKIDGKSGTLGWSHLPCGGAWGPGNSLDQLYDTGEPWSAYGDQYLQSVFAHEIGHALGLDHLESGNLMQPYAVASLYLPQPGDIAEVRARYGAPKPAPSPPTDPPAVENVLIGELIIPTGSLAGKHELLLRKK